MSNKKTTGLIKEIISKALKCDKRRIFVKTDLVNDLGADSMQVLQIIIAVERELGVEIDDERLGNSLNGGGITIRKLIDEVKRKVHASDAFKKPVRYASGAAVVDENRTKMA